MLRSFEVPVSDVLRIIREADRHSTASRIFANTSNLLKQNNALNCFRKNTNTFKIKKRNPAQNALYIGKCW